MDKSFFFSNFAGDFGKDNPESKKALFTATRTNVVWKTQLWKGRIVNAFGVWDKKKMAGREYYGILRTTFIVNENGIIDEVFTKVDTKNHTEQITKVLE